MIKRKNIERLEREALFHNELQHERNWFRDNLYDSELIQPVEDGFWQAIGCVKGLRVLDYGCGEGELSFELARRGATVTGIDISERRVQAARQRSENENCTAVEFFIGDSTSLDFPSSSFDTVVGKSILHHLDLALASSEIHRVLKSEGRAVFIEPLAGNPVISLVRRLSSRSRSADEQPFRKKDLIQLRNAFSACEEEYFISLSLLHIPLRILLGRDSPRILKFLQRLERLFNSSVVGRFLSWQVVVTLFK